jgi:hypothetical protein
VPGELFVLLYMIQEILPGNTAQQGGDHSDDREVIRPVKQYGWSPDQPVAMAKTDDHLVAIRRLPEELHQTALDQVDRIGRSVLFHDLLLGRIKLRRVSIIEIVFPVGKERREKAICLGILFARL